MKNQTRSTLLQQRKLSFVRRCFNFGTVLLPSGIRGFDLWRGQRLKREKSLGQKSTRHKEE